MKSDYYATLGLTPGSEDIVIRAAYLALMRHYHPDKNSSPRAAARAQAVTAAYAVLGDIDQRAEYDWDRRSAEAAAEPPDTRLTNRTLGLISASITVMLLLSLYFFHPPFTPRETLEAPKATEHEENASRLDAASLCALPTTHALLKKQLIQRAVQLRGGDRESFQRMVSDAIVRIDSPLLATGDDKHKLLYCKASVAVLLPASKYFGNGQRKVSGEIDYSVQRATDSQKDTVIVWNGDLISRPLASIGQVTFHEEVAVAEPVLPERRVTGRPSILDEVPSVSAPAQRVPLSSREQLQGKKEEMTAKPSANPSFNCRFAKPGAETAICSNDKLAELDRFLESFYSQSMANGDAKKRAALVQTKDRFLVRRARCRSDPCLREEYSRRLKEIAEIVEKGQPGSPL